MKRCCVLIVTMLKFCEHCKKYRDSTQYPSVEMPWKWRVSAVSWVIHLKIRGNCPLKESLHTRKLEETKALYAVEATFAIIYLCPLFSTGLNFSIKYVSYDSDKILLSFRIAKVSKGRNHGSNQASKCVSK